jgi:hypothetical protein
MLARYWGLRHRCKFRWIVDSRAAIGGVEVIVSSHDTTTYHPKYPNDVDLISLIQSLNPGNYDDQSKFHGSKDTRTTKLHTRNSRATLNSMWKQIDWQHCTTTATADAQCELSSTRAIMSKYQSASRGEFSRETVTKHTLSHQRRISPSISTGQTQLVQQRLGLHQL